MIRSICHFFLCIALMAGVAACNKPYQTKLLLAVDHSPEVGMKIGTAEAGNCVIRITSNSTWTASVTPEDGDTWCSLDRTSGEGIAYLILTYDENTGTEDRKAFFTVSGSGKTISFPIIQVKP